MQAQTESTTVTTLIMGEEEVAWLKQLMQNPIVRPITPPNPIDENPLDANMRQTLWNVLDNK